MGFLLGIRCCGLYSWCCFINYQANQKAMFHFITASLPADANLEKVTITAKKYNFAWVKLENLSVCKQLDVGSSYFFTTKRQCDCGTLLGSANNTSEVSKVDLSSKISALKKKGWSATKIERWLSEKSDIDKKQQAKNGNSIGLVEVEAWKYFISEVLSTKLSSKVGVILHMYSGSVSTESIKLSDKVITKLKNLNDQVFLNMHEDHLYEFVIS